MANKTIEELLGRSNRLGSNPKFTNYAGGNTSAKGDAMPLADLVSISRLPRGMRMRVPSNPRASRDTTARTRRATLGISGMAMAMPILIWLTRSSVSPLQTALRAGAAASDCASARTSQAVMVTRSSPLFPSFSVVLAAVTASISMSVET